MAKGSNDNLARAHPIQQWHGPDSALRRGHSAPRSPRIGMLNGLVGLSGAGSGAWLDLVVPVLRSGPPSPRVGPRNRIARSPFVRPAGAPDRIPQFDPIALGLRLVAFGRSRPDLAGSLVGVDRDLGLGDRAAGQLRPRAGSCRGR